MRDDDLRVGKPKKSAAGVPGVVHGLADVLEQSGIRRGVKSLRLVNQHGGFSPEVFWATLRGGNIQVSGQDGGR